MQKVYNFVSAILVAIKVWFLGWFLKLPVYKRWVAVIGSIAIIALASQILPVSETVTESEVLPKKVELSLVSDLSNRATSVPLVGVVTSVSEATVRAESGGRLTRVYKKLGDRVSAGQVIAEFENSLERASVLQAEGAYDGSKAARDIAIINTQSTNININDTKTNSLNVINSTFATLDDMVRSKTDTAFTDPRTQTPRFKVLIPDSLLQSKIENQRVVIEKILVERFATNMTLTQDSDLISELQKIQNETQIIKNYFDDLGNAYVKALPDQNFSQSAIEANKAVVGANRSIISGTLSTISGSKVALQNAISAQEIAGRTTGDKNPNTASSDAQVKSARGGYLAALSRLEKTIVRSPISGTLNSFSIQTGDFVTPSAQVAIVSNNGALEILAYVTPDDAQRISVGSPVLIDSMIKGIVTRLAGAIDPVTKKIELSVGILNDNSGLINGVSVRLEISDSPSRTSYPLKGKVGMGPALIKIPLSAVKITPRGSYVFTLSASSTLVSLPVEIGSLLGEEVEIIKGLTGDMEIVKDARGLKEGDTVTK